MKIKNYLLRICFLIIPVLVHAQFPFDQSELDFNGLGNVSSGVTSLMFGPDGRLYVAEYPGTIKILTIERVGTKDYQVTAIEELNGILTMADHNDDGTLFNSVSRETTGITVGGTATNPVFYVSSSDFRIGAGTNGGNGDVGLDTNSGVITRFSYNGSSWDVVDIVRGLPRSEENHATNGLELATINGTDYLIVASGGHTNGGGPSTNFVYTCEYALSAAVLAVDLDALESLPILNDNGRDYIYDLPTLDDPTRANANGITDPDDPGYDGIDVNDPFGGNDGLNMAIIDPAGPVQVLSPGYRNAYDLVVTKSGALFVTDNGANIGWGGFPVNEGGGSVTNDYDPAEPGSTSPDTDGEFIDNKDHLHLITNDLSTYTFNSFYGGHPNPVRANPSGAGLYTDDDQGSAVWRTAVYDPDGSTPGSTTDPALGLPANWPPVQMANSVEGDWRGPTQTNPEGFDDDPLVNWGTNTNGIDEYTASNFNGGLQGSLMAGVNNGVIRRVAVNADGTLNTFTPEFLSGIAGGTGNALGITCNDDNEIFPGTIWAGTLNGVIEVFEPTDFVNCIDPSDPAYDPNADNDNDGYTNQDEEDNGTDPCNGGSQPTDFDEATGGSLISDLNDTDDDADSILDSADPFQLGNPLTSGSDAFTIPVSNDLFNDQQGLGGIFGLGMTGLMNNGDTGANWLDWIDRRDDPNDPNPNDVLGGAPGLMTSHMTSGTALGATNTQEKGYQYGVQSDSNTGEITVSGGMNGFEGPLRLYGNTAAVGGELGFFIGDGTQSNYIKFVVTTDGFTALQEINDVPQTPITVTIAEADRPSSTGGIEFYFVIDSATGNVDLEYEIDAGGRQTLGSIQAQGSILTAIQNAANDLAVGFIGTSGTVGVELEGTWDFLNVSQERPFISSDIPDYEVLIGSATEMINLNEFFGDDDGFAGLTLTVEANSNPNFLTSITNGVLAVDYPNLIESSTIVVRATDANNLFVEQTFQASVLDGFTILYRVNCGGPELNSIDGEINWEEDSSAAPSQYLSEIATSIPFAGEVSSLDASIDQSSVPFSLFGTERFDSNSALPNMTYSFPVGGAGNYEVRLFMGDGFTGTAQAGQRIFDVAIEGQILPELDNVDLSATYGSFTGAMISYVVQVTDGVIDIEFIHDVVENPLVNGIEILDVPDLGIPIVLDPLADQNTVVGEQLDGSLGIAATGGDGNLVYQATNLPPGITVEPTNGTLSGTVGLTADQNSPYLVTVTVDDSDAFTNDAQSYQFNWNVFSKDIWRINAGGTLFTTQNLVEPWQDNSVEGMQNGLGYTVNTGFNVASGLQFANRDLTSLPAYIDQATFDAIFKTERFDNDLDPEMMYTIPLENGQYTVNIYVGDSFANTSQPGQRVFDISMEGTVVQDNLDLITEFGFGVGGMLTYTVTVADGELNIEFLHEVENPVINAIEIIKVDTNFGALTLDAIADQTSDVSEVISVQAVGAGGNPAENPTFFMIGQPAGITIDSTTGLISGTIDSSASIGGPNGDGVHPVKVTMFQKDSAPISISFSWSILNAWIDKDEDESYTPRHENSFVQSGDKFYLMGGRESAKTIDIYDYTSNTWQSLVDSAPFEFNHFQATEYKGLIWVIGTFETNNFPNEVPADNIWIFDPSDNTWIQGPEIPAARRRGAAGLVVYNDKFYVLAGNTQGHNGGYVSWFDEYDPSTGQWTALTDAPRARDHFSAVLIGDKLYAAGGRLSGGPDGTFAPTIAEVDVYDFTNSTWSTLPIGENIPTPRAGAVTVNFNDKLVVIGGEVQNQEVYGVVTTDALKVTEEYDPATSTWTRLPDMNFDRHGTQGIVSGNGIFVLAGSPNLGGGNQKNMEYFGEDNPQGEALIVSELEADQNQFIAEGTSEIIDFTVGQGNVGLYVDRFELTGTDAVEFTIVSGELSGQLLMPGQVHPVEVALSAGAVPKSAILTVYYGNGRTTTVNLSNSNLPPVLENPGDQVNEEGDTVSLQLNVQDENPGLTFSAQNLPPSLTIDSSTGLISGVLDLPEQGVNVFQESGGVVAIEMENTPLQGEWSTVTVDGETGITSNSNHFNNPLGGGLITYEINFTTPGIYRIIWNTSFSGSSPTDENDTWLKFDNSNPNDLMYFGYKGFTPNEQTYIDAINNNVLDNLTFPKGSGLENDVPTSEGGTEPQGPGGEGYFKVYRSGGTTGVLKWQSSTSDEDAHNVFLWVKNAGTYTMEVRERSIGHVLDKIVIYKLTNHPSLNTEVELDAVAESAGSLAPGASDGSPYTVQVSVEDQGGLMSTEEFTWFVNESNNQPPVAIASSDAVSGNAPLEVNFTGSGSTDDNTDIVSYEWDFGTGDLSTDADPVYTFTTGGEYTVSLTVTDGGGLQSSTSLTITVNGAPIAVASSDINSGNEPLTVNFTGNASTDDNNDIVSYEWDFGTGDMSTDVDPSYTFLTGGVYTVSLTVTDGGGLSSTATVEINVNGAPVAIASSDVTSGNAPLTVNFTGSGSTDDNNDIVSYEWDFGTGDLSTDADPSYVFANPGTYTVGLTVTDGAGLSSSTTIQIDVNGPPVAIASANISSGNAPLSVDFTGSGSTDDNDDIVSYEWDFGTGDMSTEADPTYVFNDGGVYTVSLTVTDGGGLTSTTTVEINVNGAPVAIASSDITTGNAPLEVNFIGSGSTDDNDDIVSYAWDFGTGDSSIAADPTYTFDNEGTYTVSLTVTDGGGLSSSTTIEITVLEDNNTPPIARIIANPTEGDAPLPVIFDGSTSSDDAGIVSYLWDFDDGTTSNEISPVKSFDQPGVFNVILTVTDTRGVTDSDSVTITVTDPNANKPPVAVASSSVSGGQAPLTVTFTGSNSTDDNGIVSYTWIFGDGVTSSEINPTHVYTTAGTYNAILTVVDGEGLSDSASVTIVVDPAPDNEPPVAVASATPLSGEAPLEVSFTGSASTDDKGIVTYAWDFMDGTTSSSINPVHTFTGVGTFMVTLTVTDQEGLTDVATLSIEVSEPVENQAPVASASATPLSGFAPLEVSFDSSGSTDDVGIVSYSWDFQDGTTSTAQNPVHTFTTAGEYQVVLTVADVEGLTDTATVTITVNSDNMAPIAMATATPLSGIAPLFVTFDSSASSDDSAIVSYFWDFDDGTTSSDPNPTKTFTQIGTYDVSLTVQDAEGLSDTAIVQISVNPENQDPVAIATASVTTGEAPLLVQFNGSASTDDKGIIEYFWDFDDGITSQEVNPSHVFNFAGTFEVVLRVEDEEGQSDSVSVSIEVTDNNSTGTGSTMQLVVVTNPASEIATIAVQNIPQGEVINSLYVHDSSGRLIATYLPQEVFVAGNYQIPVGSLRDEMYFVTVETINGETAGVRLLVRNGN